MISYMENLGFLYALGAALAWGTYFVPFKLSRSSNFPQFQALMGLGVLASGLILSLVTGYSLDINIFGIISGILWGIANVISLTAVANLGISKATPIMSSLVILISFLWGALFFNELSSGLVTGFLGVALIVGGVVLVGSVGNNQSQNVGKGLTAAILAGILFGSQFVPVKLANIAGRDFFFSMSVGVFITAFVIALLGKVKLKKEAIKMSLLSGAIWNVGNLAGTIAISLIGLARGLPITQTAVLIGIVWGIFYFKEIRSKKSIAQVLAGSIILLLGIIILGAA